MMAQKVQPNVDEIINTLRTMRDGMVQREEQYQFIFETLKDWRKQKS